MTAGNQPTMAQINATVGGFATQLRTLFQGVRDPGAAFNYEANSNALWGGL